VDSVECIVVGAGVIGIAVARALALAGREVVIVEAEPHFGMQTSSRNSEVIHAGIYYPQGSLKARLCVAGRERLYAHCESRHIPHRRCGKLIVATRADQVEQLERIRLAAQANGVTDVDFAPPATIRAEEPALAFVEALHSPSTGIVDSHQFMISLLGDAQEAGAMIAYGTRVSGAAVEDDGIALHFDDAPPIKARRLVNSAGLDAAALASRIAGLDAAHVPDLLFAKGSYFTLAGRSPFSTLIYPVPSAGGLGVHLTIDISGQARFGPDVEWINALDYDVDPGRADGFYAAIRAYWPGLPDGSLQPGYAGVRPKLHRAGEPAADFRIDGPARHGVPGLVNLFGIESPGLTASLAIADHVAELLA